MDREKVLIVAKTRMKDGVCVSGLTQISHRGVRLLPKNRRNQSVDTAFDIGQVWEMEFQNAASVEPPHVEDVIVFSTEYVGRVTNLRKTLMRHVQPWQGGPENLFDRTLIIDARKCYVSRSGPLPHCSTGYWIPDRRLILDQNENKYYYLVEYKRGYGGTLSQTLSVPFVGFETPVREIPAGTLVRVSLARWLNVSGEDRCYLQISGWYL